MAIAKIDHGWYLLKVGGIQVYLISRSLGKGLTLISNEYHFLFTPRMHTFSTFSILAAVARVSLGVQIHNIMVGANDTLTFMPSSISASPGDVVNFQFQAKNHSVTQSTFASPCQQSGLSSPFEVVSSTPLVFHLTVNDTNPTWYFCAQTVPADHCMMGMVFAINPTADKTFDMFQRAAMGTGGSTGNVSSSAGASPSASNASPSLSAIPSGMQTIASSQNNPTPAGTETNTITATDDSTPTSDPGSSSSVPANSGLKTASRASGLLWVAGAFLGWVL
ncbi:Cupredoxin [Infundibulicybe gibba]|nr:Cupredoxin [Infundibulicybe gibba]